MFPPWALFLKAWGTSRFPTPLPAHGPTDVAPSPLVLSLRGMSKAYGAVQALRDVTFDCRAGEIHALVGENGSGKSTLLGIASGVLGPDAGAVEIGGRSSVVALQPGPGRWASASRIRRTRTSPT